MLRGSGSAELSWPGNLGWLARVSCVVASLCLVAPPLFALDVPFLSGRVVDSAQLLDEAAELRIEETLRQLEADTGAQIAVLTIDSLEGEVLEDYSLRVAETWALGRAEVDDGVLILVVHKERKIRIEVGYGLEGVIPDVLARRIIEQQMTPQFREGDFAAGIEAAVASAAGLVRGDPDALPEQATESTSAGDTEFLLIMVLGLGPFLWTAVASRGCAGWFFYLFVSVFVWGFSLAVLGESRAFWITLAWLVAGFLLRLVLPQRVRQGSGGWVSSSGWGGSSGGGFSGGGGSFGGGGSSGGW